MRHLVILLVLLVLPACGVLLPVEGASVVTTDKTLGDHLISFSSGKNCSSVRLEQGKEYCVEDEKVIQPAVHCYRTIGDVTCYRSEDPFSNGESKVGINDHNQPHNRQTR